MAEPLTPASPPQHSSNTGSRYLDKVPDIVRCLKSLRDERANLILRLDGSSESYQGKVLDVSATEFLVEDIVPRSGNRLLREGTTFSISARSAGLFAFIEDVRIALVDAERGLPFYHVRLPRRILLQQRRRAARFHLPLRVSANGASVTLFREQTMVGNLIDLSVGGCRVEFDGTPDTPIRNDEEVDVCTLTLSHLMELHSKGTIRHATFNKTTKKLVVGIELTEMHVTDRRRLERFVQSIAKAHEVVA